MALTESDVEKIARLARLSINAAERSEVTARLGSILGMVDRLQAAATAGVAPMAHPLDAVQPLREDRVTETNHRDEYQRIAPATESGLYLVPRVIE
ncbi:MAG: Asp-tRNA(Asn)/Glu-tRNA(Gln) amidotransferase subunit GatC [Gammaproteobacteria bacterium]